MSEVNEVSSYSGSLEDDCLGGKIDASTESGGRTQHEQHSFPVSLLDEFSLFGTEVGVVVGHSHGNSFFEDSAQSSWSLGESSNQKFPLFDVLLGVDFDVVEGRGERVASFLRFLVVELVHQSGEVRTRGRFELTREKRGHAQGESVTLVFR